jgi:hypothetical protein
MINSKPHLSSEISLDIYVSAIVCSAFSFPVGAWALLEYLQSKSRCQNICSFFAVAQRYRNRSLCVCLRCSHWRLNVPQKSTECILSIKRELERCRCSCHRTAYPGSCNLNSGKPRGPGFQHKFLCARRLAGQLLLPTAARNLPPCPTSSPLHSTPRGAVPAPRIFLHELLVGCLLPVANQLAA